MQQLILKNDLDKNKIDALLHFLKSWNIDAELKTTTTSAKKSNIFSLSAGIWEGYDIDGVELRKQAWNRNK
jgi:hypothetical protein